MTALYEVLFNKIKAVIFSFSENPQFSLVLVGIALSLMFSTISNSQVRAYSAFDSKVVELINIERQKYGLKSLVQNSKLAEAALNHNKTMNSCSAKYNSTSCFSHQVKLMNEPSLMTRISQTGYSPVYVAENIAWGYTTPESVVRGWMNSAPHKANILTANALDIGCNYLDGNNGESKRIYWTCNFGKSSNTQVTAFPTPTVTIKPTPTPTAVPVVSTSYKYWWCKYIPTHTYCK